MGTNTSVGFAAPQLARYVMMPIGISTSPEALSTRNISIASVAVSFFGFSSCMCCIAFRPSGVAALSRPSMLAEMFMKIDPIAGWFFGMPGNRRVNNGLTRRPKKGITPPFSPIFIMPIHNDSTPVKPNDSSKAVFAESNDELMTRDQMSISPLTIDSKRAKTKVRAKNPIQI